MNIRQITIKSAYDAGFDAALYGIDAKTNPYDSVLEPGHWQSWAAGHAESYDALHWTPDQTSHGELT